MAELDDLATAIGPDKVRPLTPAEHRFLVEDGRIPKDVAPDLASPLSRSDYEYMVEEGLFADERLELLRGVLVERSAEDRPHADAVDRLADALRRALGPRARARLRSPLALGDDSEPEPDIAVVSSGTYRAAHPKTALLVVEVAAATLRKDRGLKAEIYAASGIPEYWIVNLAERVLEVHRDPARGAYRGALTFGAGDSVGLVAFPEVTIGLADVLG